MVGTMNNQRSIVEESSFEGYNQSVGCDKRINICNENLQCRHSHLDHQEIGSPDHTEKEMTPKQRQDILEETGES